MGSQDKMLPLTNFLPKELSAAEKDAGVLGMTQSTGHSTEFTSKEIASQWPTQTQTSHPGFFTIWCSHELFNEHAMICSAIPILRPKGHVHWAA